VIYFTFYGSNCRFYVHCIFFTLQFCDEHHFIHWHTPYIYVTQITLFLPVWTVKVLSAKFHDIRTGLGNLCHRINNKPRAEGLRKQKEGVFYVIRFQDQSSKLWSIP